MTRASLLLLVTVAACVDGPDIGTDVAALFNDDGCPKSGCSSNSPFLGPLEFHELHEGGRPNLEGLSISSFTTANGNVYIPDVTGTVLTAKKKIGLNFWITISGQNLVGSTFHVSGDGGVQYEITITKVTNTQVYWQAPYTTLETYELMWRQTGTTLARINVCSNPPDRLDDGGREWANVNEAILFTGDRYDTTTLEVTETTPAGSGGWFNIGCAGNVMAKLVLNRHAHASQLTASPTTRAQRQTMLKMYTSDVCGSGRAFTVQGTPLRWWAANGWSSLPGSYPYHEAVWDEDGVVCLNMHRLHFTSPPYDEIFDECGTIPACTSYGLSMNGPYLRTAFPPPGP